MGEGYHERGLEGAVPGHSVQSAIAVPAIRPRFGHCEVFARFAPERQAWPEWTTHAAKVLAAGSTTGGHTASRGVSPRHPSPGSGATTGCTPASASSCSRKTAPSSPTPTSGTSEYAGDYLPCVRERSTRAMSTEALMPRAAQRRKSRSTDGDASPRSSSEMYARSISALAATSCWVSFASSRARRSSGPSGMGGNAKRSELFGM